MSWNAAAPEDPLKSLKYIEILRLTAAAVLGQETALDAAGVLKAPYFIQWAIESNNGGGYESKKKFARATYELVAGPNGLTSRCPPTETAHVEHVWTVEKTKALLVDAYTLAQQALTACRLTRTQCIEALMTIIEARRHTVLMPASLMRHEQFKHNSALDGFTARYGTCMVIRRGGVKIDFEEEDRVMQDTVDDAFEYLRAGAGSRSWPWQRRVVAAKPKPIVTIAPPKTSNAATTLHTSKPAVVESILRAAMVTMQISPDSPSNPGADLDNGYSFKRVGGVKVILSGVKFSGQGGFSTGRFEALPGKPKFRDLSLEEFEEHVETIVQGIQRGVY